MGFLCRADVAHPDISKHRSDQPPDWHICRRQRNCEHLCPADMGDGLRQVEIAKARDMLILMLACLLRFFGSVIFARRFYAAAALLIAEFVFRSSIVAFLDNFTISEASAILSLHYGFVRIFRCANP